MLRSKVFEALALPASFWSADVTLDALAARDVGHLFRLVQKATGASQTQIGIATGLSQAQVSEIMSGRRQVTTIDVLGRVVAGLAMPDHARTVLLLGDNRSTMDVAPTEPATVPQRRPLTEGVYADVAAVFATRAEFMSALPPPALFDGARDIRAVGLSLNLLCQQYGDSHLTRLVADGATVRLLFLDPDGESIRAREREEHWPAGHLSNLTALNLQAIAGRVRDRLDDNARDRLQVGVYDENVRFNVIIIDEQLCIAQPYLPDERGINSPTLVIRRDPGKQGLYATFAHIFETLWGRATGR